MLINSLSSRDEYNVWIFWTSWNGWNDEIVFDEIHKLLLHNMNEEIEHMKV